jgi:hypothetical protein
MDISDASKHVLWMRRMICTIMYSWVEPANIITDINVFNNNNGAVFLSQESAINQRSKHINSCFHFIRDLVKLNRIKTQQISTTDMPADMLTKNAGAVVINQCRRLINNISLAEYNQRNSQECWAGGALRLLCSAINTYSTI